MYKEKVLLFVVCNIFQKSQELTKGPTLVIKNYTRSGNTIRCAIICTPGFQKKLTLTYEQRINNCPPHSIFKRVLVNYRKIIFSNIFSKYKMKRQITSSINRMEKLCIYRLLKNLSKELMLLMVTYTCVCIKDTYSTRFNCQKFTT